MKYNEVIRSKLREIEQKESVRILHAVESGSRAWGFASPDSDYDVRFIYVRNEAFYLSLRDRPDHIDWELNEVLDINGWDLKKALQHFHKSNSVLFEWSNSPVVYDTTDEWRDLYTLTLKDYFSCKTAMYQYYGTAAKNYREYLTTDMVKYKKYFYVLRPLLACRWIEKRECPPPVLFEELLQTVLEEKMQGAVRELLSKKMQMAEAELAPQIPEINCYIEDKLMYFRKLTENMPDDRNPDWEPLDAAFRGMLPRQNIREKGDAV